ncbi:hypothetical protein Mapa_002353 [Marchantia paleacea]|nr:hypothetical protein Mapa_002353 [Marchantia paleacea]
MEEAYGIRAASTASHQNVGFSTPFLQGLLPHLSPDNGLEVSDHHGERMRATYGAEYVMRSVHTIHPVHNGLGDGVPESSRAKMHRRHSRPQ